MDSNKSSFVNELLGDVLEETLRHKPSQSLPWHIPKHFHEASLAQQLRDHDPSQVRRISFIPGTFPSWSDQAPSEEPAPEQPLRDTLLNSVIGLADMLGVEWILIASRNGGTVKRLRQLTERFQLLVALLSPTEEQQLRQLANVELMAATVESRFDATGGDDEYEAALERIAQEGLNSLRQGLDGPDSSGAPVLFCYRSFPGANCVNAFQILHL